MLVFDGEKESISAFLEAARGTDLRALLTPLGMLTRNLGLRYLDFHHVDTQPFPISAPIRLAESRIGLREVSDMKALIDALDTLSLKSWFRTQMGMEKGH